MTFENCSLIYYTAVDIPYMQSFPHIVQKKVYSVILFVYIITILMQLQQSYKNKYIFFFLCLKRDHCVPEEVNLAIEVGELAVACQLLLALANISNR